jgi:hypothetical protein
MTNLNDLNSHNENPIAQEYPVIGTLLNLANEHRIVERMKSAFRSGYEDNIERNWQITFEYFSSNIQLKDLSERYELSVKHLKLIMRHTLRDTVNFLGLAEERYSDLFRFIQEEYDIKFRIDLEQAEGISINQINASILKAMQDLKSPKVILEELDLEIIYFKRFRGSLGEKIIRIYEPDEWLTICLNKPEEDSKYQEALGYLDLKHREQLFQNLEETGIVLKLTTVDFYKGRGRTEIGKFAQFVKDRGIKVYEIQLSEIPLKDKANSNSIRGVYRYFLKKDLEAIEQIAIEFNAKYRAREI